MFKSSESYQQSPKKHGARYLLSPIAVTVFMFLLVLPVSAEDPWPSFQATALDGKIVSSDKLIGQPTLLIITPSRDAAKSTRQWVAALRKNLDRENYRVRDVLAVNLPFFMSEEDVIGRAKAAVPERFYDQTWILNSSILEDALGIPPDSEIACVVVLDADGQIVARVHGALNDKRLETIVDAATTLR